MSKEKREYILVGEDMPFSIVEAYRAMRTNLMFVLGARKTNVALFTSAYMLEGKTSTCANLAITFAQSGARVLIIDADMRKPKMHRLFGCGLGSGLSEVLCGVVDDSSIQKTKYDNLYVMTAGKIPPNPADLLMSSSMDKMLETVSSSFDFVFIDVPPVGLVTDAAILAGKVGGAIMIVRKDSTRSEDVRAAKEALVQAGTDVIGYVMTGTNPLHRYGNKYGSKYGYHYYSSKN